MMYWYVGSVGRVMGLDEPTDFLILLGLIIMSAMVVVDW